MNVAVASEQTKDMVLTRGYGIFIYSFANNINPQKMFVAAEMPRPTRT